MEAKGTPDILDFGELSQRIQSPLGGLVPPLHAQTLCFWGEEQVYEHVEMDFRQPVRLKTRGDCPLIGRLIITLQLLYTPTGRRVSICLSDIFYLFVRLSVCLSVCPSNHLHICVFICKFKAATYTVESLLKDTPEVHVHVRTLLY